LKERAVRARVAIVLSSFLHLAAGCGESTLPPAEEPKVGGAGEGAGRRAAGPTVESEVGALDDVKVKQTFEHLSGRLTGCFTKGAQRVAYLAGDVRFVVRVARDGSARWVYVKESTLGDRETELCMIGALKGASWPKPQGGEGLAENTFSFDAGSEERPPVAWSPEQLGAAQKKVQRALAQCRKQAGTRSLKATMYVETDGKATAVGVASGDEKGDAAADCVIEALKGLKYPSPGSYASKVSVSAE
jgi:hypothetical protein